MRQLLYCIPLLGIRCTHRTGIIEIDRRQRLELSAFALQFSIEFSANLIDICVFLSIGLNFSLMLIEQLLELDSFSGRSNDEVREILCIP